MNQSQSTGAPDLGALGRGAVGGFEIPRPRSRWRSRLLIPLVVFLAAGALLGYAARDVLIPPLQVRVVPVIARDRHGSMATIAGAAPAGPAVQAPGWIEPDPYAINVPAFVDGIVRDVLVLEGDTVKEGQVIAHLIDEDFKLAERSAQAIVAERRADVLKAKAVIEPMRSAIAMVQSDADVIRDEINRKQGLVEGGAVSAGDVSRLEIRLRGAIARVEQSRSELAATEASLAQAEAALETAKAALAESQLRLSRTEVRSMASGVVLARLVAPGTRVAVTSKANESIDMTSTLLRLYDPAHLQVRADVPLADAARIGVDTPAEITTEALPGEKFAGKVTRVLHEANIQRNTIQFKVAIENPSPQLKPEMLARVRFNPGARAARPAQTGSDDSGLDLLLPASVLVHRSADKAQVWLVEPGSSASVFHAALRDVSLGDEHDGDVLIVSGVRPGDRAIAAPAPSLKSGVRIRVATDAPSPSTQTPAP